MGATLADGMPAFFCCHRRTGSLAVSSRAHPQFDHAAGSVVTLGSSTCAGTLESHIGTREFPYWACFIAWPVLPRYLQARSGKGTRTGRRAWWIKHPLTALCTLGAPRRVPAEADHWGGVIMGTVLAEHPARAVVRLLLGGDPAVAHAHRLEGRIRRKARRGRG